MVPIRTFIKGQLVDIGTGELYQNLHAICNEHRKENRALAFAFILYNFKNPQIFKMLEDEDYWRALNETSSHYLSIFYIALSSDRYFAEDLVESDGIESRGLHGLQASETLIPLLKPYFELDEKIKLPSVLFFQENDGLLEDYFLLALDERKLEESFWELQTYVENVVTTLEGITEDNYNNSKEIFNLLKSGVKGQRLKRKIFNKTQQFPVQLLVGWLVGKV